MKAIREREIEHYLHKQVTAAGGTTRKFKGRINDPDRIVIWPARGLCDNVPIHFIECKRPGGKARAGQLREHRRLRAFGCLVLVLNTKKLIDTYVELHR